MIESEQHRFEERYALETAVMLAIERQALGSDYGANGYTTLAEADQIGELFGLDRESDLLDLGAGCGYPGLRLAERTGCRLASVDPVQSGVQRSTQRAMSDGIDRHLGVVAEGAALPFVDASFDALVHIDVLC